MRFNHWNHDRPFAQTGPDRVDFDVVTTGNFAAFITKLDNSRSGTIELKTALINETVALGDIGYEDTVLDASDILPRSIRLFRLPDRLDTSDFMEQVPVNLVQGRDNPLWVKVTTEDGFNAWSSPMFIYR